MKHNRTPEAAALLQEIAAWCAATNTRETAIGHVLFLHPGFVGLLRLRLTVTQEKEAAVRQFMAGHPSGYHGPLPITHGNGTKPKPRKSLNGGPEQATRLSEAEIAARRVNRDSCPRCGARADYGCGHLGRAG